MSLPSLPAPSRRAKIVLDHVGGPIGIRAYAGKREEVFGRWRTSILALAACGNVHVKLGGLGMRIGGFSFHEGPEPPSSDSLARAWRPYFVVREDRRN
jgi:L-fuconolactonase